MSERVKFIRRNLIMQRLRKSPASFQEIADELLAQSEFQNYNFEISQRTFQRDIQDIASIFDVEIAYDKSDRVYRIKSEPQSKENDRICEAIDVFNVLNFSENISNCILFDNQKPKGTGYLYGILHAIKNNVTIRFTHQKYWDDDVTIRTVEPYAIKEFRNRWYVLAKDMKDNRIKTFGLDRISDLDISRTKFIFPADIKINEYFKHSFGVIRDDDFGIEDIVISYTPFQGKYVKSLPLHESQQILVDNETECRISLKLYITHDFVMELLSLGDSIKIIQPQRLINEIKEIHQNALNQYK